MRCPSCHEACESKAKFCQECGTPLTSTDQQKPADTADADSSVQDQVSNVDVYKTVDCVQDNCADKTHKPKQCDSQPRLNLPELNEDIFATSEHPLNYSPSDMGYVPNLDALPSMYRVDAHGMPLREDEFRTDYLPSWSTVQNYGVSPSDTARMPKLVVEPESSEFLADDLNYDDEARTYTLGEGRPQRSGIKKLVAACLILSLLGLSVYGLYLSKPDLFDQFTSLQQGTSPSEEQNNSVQDTKPQIDQSPQAVFATLSNYYAGLTRYSDSIGAQIDDFNSYYLIGDAARRKSYKDTCVAVQTSIKKAQEQLAQDMEKLGVGPTNSAYGQYQKINACYDVLLKRLDPIVQAWELSAQSTSPKSDQEAILAPLRASSGAKAKVEFNRLYQEAKPVEPA